MTTPTKTAGPTTRHPAPQDERLAGIARLMSTAQLEAARTAAQALVSELEQEELSKVATAELPTALASTWSREFRRHVLATYTDNLLVAVDHAVYSQSGHENDLPSRVARERESAGKTRMKAGLVFGGIGAVFILSNLLVLPLMAGAISRYVEHPAAIAIDKLRKFLESATKAGAPDSTKTALDAMRAMSGDVDSLTTTTSQLQQSLNKLKETRLDIEHSDPSASPQIKALSDAVKQLSVKLSPAPKAGEAPPPPPQAEIVLAELLAAMAATADAKANGIQVIDARRANVSDQYLIVPKTTAGMSLLIGSVDRAIGTLGEQSKYISDRRRLVDAASERVAELSSDDGKAGLLKKVTESIASLDQAGRALDELVTTGPVLADEAKAATKTLSSVAGFVLPYAFAVLAIGAMLVSIGVTSVLKSLRHSDEKYEEMVDLNKTLLLSRLAVAMHGQGASADALIERLARVGDSTKKAEGGVPLPVARAVAEVAKALKQG
jgi:hypothetical protein